MTDLRRQLETILRASPQLMQVLEVARQLDLPDWLLFSGAVYQPVLNHLTGRASDFGLKDYDLGYFDASDISYAAEDVIIRRVAAAFEPLLRDLVEVRNQARVHLWFAAKFGGAYTPLKTTAEALQRFTSATFAVGVRLDPKGAMQIVAPFGLEDLFSLRIRPNPLRQTAGFAGTASAAQARWPEITVDR